MPRKTTKKATKKTAKKVATKRKTGYELTVAVNDVKFKSQGKTIREALEKFIASEQFPFGAKTPAVFTVKKGNKDAVLRLYPQRARRMFLTMNHRSTAVEVFSAQLERHLNG